MTNTAIIETTLKNGKIAFEVFHKNSSFQICVTLKSAQSIADKLERFNGRLYATHFKFKGRPLCKTAGIQDTTKDESEVTCPRCLARMAKKNK